MKIRIATRTSELAMAQTNMVHDALTAGLSGCEVEVIPYKTSGDRFLDKGLHEFQGKGAFTKEIEDALLRNEADLAVHSLKDLPTALPPGLEVLAYLPRELPFDCLVSDAAFNDLPKGARLGTGSVRRIAQLRFHRPDILAVPIRGNVRTRLRKLQEQGLDGVILAAAGLIRLGLQDRITELLKPPRFVPAAGQGIIAVESRAGWDLASAVQAVLDDEDSRFQAAVERGILDALGGGCHAPVGVHAVLTGLGVRVWAVAQDGNGLARFDRSYTDRDPEGIVRDVVEGLRG